MAHSGEAFKLSATFAVVSPVIIRSGFEAEFESDVVHLTSRGDEKDGVPMLLGTSLVGVIASGALHIARTVAGVNSEKAEEFVESMFGKPDRSMTAKKRQELAKHASA
jgi:hypothetical protein